MDAIVTVNESQRIVQFNAAAERVFRWPRAAVIGQKLDMRWLNGERLFTVLGDAAPTGVRDADPAYWQLRLDALRMANRPDLVVDEEPPYSAIWLTPLTPGDLLRRDRAHRYWAEGTFGLMGRTPDHVAALITAFAARPDIFDRGGSGFGERVGAFYRLARANDWHLAAALTPPQIDRSKPAHDQPEPFLYPGIVEERDDGARRDDHRVAAPEERGRAAPRARHPQHRRRVQVQLGHARHCGSLDAWPSREH